MSCLGVHFALDETAAALLRATRNQAERRRIVTEDIEERYLGKTWALETGKAWDAIHRCLTDARLLSAAPWGLQLCILGGKQLYTRSDYIISLVESKNVLFVAKALMVVSEEVMREMYFGIDPADYGMELSEDDFGYTWSNFEPLPSFFARAAAENRTVIFTADQ